MTRIEIKEKELRLAFMNLSPELTKWGKIVDNKIITALKATPKFNYDQHVKISPKFRVKNIDSFIKKALYRKDSGKNYDDPIFEIQDKVATRIVVLTSQHMELVKDILLEQLSLWECSIGRDKALIKESIKEFDYEAIHLIVSPTERQRGINKINIPFLTCEIQIKTLFQHAYSEMSHDTVYKGPYKHDLILLRKLARSMALLESTDETFDSMYSHINSGKGLAFSILQELFLLFRKVDTSFNEISVDMDLDSYVLDELMGNEVLTKIELSDVSSFVETEKTVLQRINSKANFLLGKHPVMIILSYLLKFSPSYLYKIDFDIDMLQSLASMLNVNYEPNA